LWNLTTGELLWMSEALMGGYGTLGIHRGATPVVDAFMARPPSPKFKAYFLDEADGALEPAEDRLLVFMHNEPGAPCYLFDVESGSLLRDLSPGLDATARTGWLLSHSKLPSAEVMESMKASRGMYSRFTDFSRFEDWWWCTSTQVSWCLHRTVDRALGVVDLQSGEVLQKMKGRSPIIHSSGKRFAYILGSDLVIEEIGSASREVIEISDIAKPRIIQSANEAWFVIASSPGDEDLNVGESIQLYRWDHLHFKPEFVRTYHVSSLLLGRVYPWIIPEANLILLSNSAGEVLLLPMDPVAHAKKYCADMGVALPGWRRAAMGLPQEEGG